jgi:hypothetical protein
MTNIKGFRPPRATRNGCLLALLLFASVASAQNANGTARTIATKARAPASDGSASARLTPERLPAPRNASYAGGQIRVHARDATLAEILTDIGALIGVNIDIPAGASREKIAVAELGPGPAREILTSLLTGSTFDYLIQDSDSDPEKIQDVILLPREKRGGAPSIGNPPADVSNGTYARSPARSPKAEDALPPAGRPNGAADVASVNPPPPEPDQSAAPPAAEPNKTTQLPLSASDQSGLARPGALSPPQTMSPQSINQQLQSMYQQRIQMIQSAGPSAAANQGK